MLDQRLNSLAQLVDDGARVIDVGTDHAYVPVDLVRNHKVEFAIASDIGIGPTKNAQKNVNSAKLSDKIMVRRGSGLSTLRVEDNVDTVIIAGMGGQLINEILATAEKLDHTYQTLIIEPNTDVPLVRKWMVENSYKIIAEEIISEDAHIYQVIKARKLSGQTKGTITEKEALFGPMLLQEKNQTFNQKWQNRLVYLTDLLKKLNNAKNQQSVSTKIRDVQNEIELIKELLDDQNK